MPSDPFAQRILEQLRSHIGAVSEQQEALAAHGADYREEACRLNRGLHELEVAAKGLEAKARSGAA